MAVTSGFFNSIDEDRLYDAEQMSSILDGVILDGIFNIVPIEGDVSNNDKFHVEAYDGMTIRVGRGKAWFNHTWTVNDVKLSLTLDEAHSVYQRIDAVVLEVDTRVAKRENSIKIINGTPSATPARPTLTKVNGLYQYALAYITVNRSATSIEDSDITDVVGSEETPLARSISDAVSLQIADNLYTNDPSYALSARQGYILRNTLTEDEIQLDETEEKADTLINRLQARDGTEFRFGKTQNGEYGYYVGADTVVPFRKGATVVKLGTASFNGATFDVKSYTGWEAFEVNKNFFIGPYYYEFSFRNVVGVKTNTFTSQARDQKVSGYSDMDTASKQSVVELNRPNLSYNAGTLTVNGLQGNIGGDLKFYAALINEDTQGIISSISGGSLLMNFTCYADIYLVY